VVGRYTARATVGSPGGDRPTTHAAVGSPNVVLYSLDTVTGKPTFAAAAAGISDAAHASTIAQDQSTISNDVATVGATDLHQSIMPIAALPITALPAVEVGRTATCAFPIEDNDWGNLTPLGPRTLRDAAANDATGEAGHHVNHRLLQVFDLQDLLPSDSESEEKCDSASEFDDCGEF
jgi:hypothetical protein